MASVRRSEAQWRDLIARWQQSGESAKAFCLAHGISLARFYKRRRELRPDPAQKFVPVRVRADSVVVQIGDISVRCSASTPVSWIADLARALR